MKRQFERLKRAFISKKFLRFCLLGTINTFNTALFSSAAHLIFQENLAAIIGYLSSLTIAFFISSRFVFKCKPTIMEYIRFLISYIPHFIIYFLVTFLTIKTLNLPQFWGTVIATAAGGPVTFIIIKLYVFGQKAKHISDDGAFS